MKPILYDYNERTFDNQGLGVLYDAISCTVTEERNGQYECQMVYDINGVHFSEILNDRILLVKSNDSDDPQPFRIYKITKPLNGRVNIYAEHVSYQLSKIPVTQFTATNVISALQGLKTHALIECPFTFWTDKTTAANFSVTEPVSIRSRLGGTEGSILDVYGGEWKFDRFNVMLYGSRGADNGVTLRYGKNIIDVSQEENIASVVTGIVPFWRPGDDEGSVITLTNPVVYIDNAQAYPYQKVVPVDFSERWTEQPTQAQLLSAATAYINANAIGIPSVSIRVSFVALWQTEEYKNIIGLEHVRLCDTVTVEFDKLGVSAKAKVVKTVYDALKEQYESIEIGKISANFGDSIRNDLAHTIRKEAVTRTALAESIDRATQLITGGLGGYVVLKGNANGQPEELLILGDDPDYTVAQKIWRWNRNGLGYSSTGYNGSFPIAITSDGHIVASFIDTGTLNAALVDVINLCASNINSGVYRASKNGKEVFYVNVDTGEVRIVADNFSLSNGDTIESIAQEALDSVEVGGRNLLVNTGGSDVTKVYGVGDTSNGRSSELTFSMTDGVIRIVRDSGETNARFMFLAQQETMHNLQAGRTYNLSFDLKGITANRIVVHSLYYVNGEWVSGDLNKAVFRSTDSPLTDYIKVSETDSIPANATAYTLGIYVYGTSDIYVRGLMLEHGNVASAWVPAPEDMTKEIANAIESQTQTDIFNKLTNNGQTQGLYLSNGKLYLNASYLKTGILSVSKNGKEVFYVDVNTGTVRIVADSFSLGNGDTIDSLITEAIDGIKVGGRNLLLGTGGSDASKIYGVGDTANTIARFTASMDSGTLRLKGYDESGYDYSIMRFFLTSPVGMHGTVAGETYTVSFYIRGTFSNNVLFTSSYYSGSTWNTNTVKAIVTASESPLTGWKYVSFTETVSASARGYTFGIRVNAPTQGTDIYIKNLMFEQGNTATAWTPAPEDVNDEIAAQIDGQTQLDIFNKLTNNGTAQGLYLVNGQLYVSFNYAKGGYLDLGGQNNGNGYLRVYDNSDNLIGAWTRAGITINAGQFNINSNFIADTSGNLTTKSLTADNYIRVVGNQSSYFKIPFFTGTGDIILDDTGFWINANSDSQVRINKIANIDQSPLLPAFGVSTGYVEVNYSKNSNTWYAEVTPYEVGLFYSPASGTGHRTLIRPGYIDVDWGLFEFNGNAKTFKIDSSVTVTGTKSRVASTQDYGDRMLYCYETPSPLFGDAGEGVIGDDGRCYVTIDPVLAETITTAQYQVFLQKYGNGDCYVEERNPGYFVVAGTSGMPFGWEIKAKQRDYDQRRLDSTQDYIDMTNAVDYAGEGESILTAHDYGAMAIEHLTEIRQERSSL